MSGRRTDPELVFVEPGRTVFLAWESVPSAFQIATERNFVIFRVEGGIWREGRGCEMRLDAIWDGALPPVDGVSLARNNDRLLTLLREDRSGCDTFVVSPAANTQNP